MNAYANAPRRERQIPTLRVTVLYWFVRILIEILCILIDILAFVFRFLSLAGLLLIVPATAWVLAASGFWYLMAVVFAFIGTYLFLKVVFSIVDGWLISGGRPSRGQLLLVAVIALVVAGDSDDEAVLPTHVLAAALIVLAQWAVVTIIPACYWYRGRGEHPWLQVLISSCQFCAGLWA